MAVQDSSSVILRWESVSMSSTGQYLTALASSIPGNSGIYTSSDYGLTWSQLINTNNTITPPWNRAAVSVSSSGQNQIACVFSESIGKGWIYISFDFGTSWNEVITMPEASPGQWTSVSISSSGQYQTACEWRKSLFVSSDYGSTWFDASIDLQESLYWQSVSISSSGKYQTAVATNVHDDVKVFTSSDFGVTWFSPALSPTPNNARSVSVSSSGQYQIFSACGKIYISSNYGQNWTVASAPGANACWTAVGVSSSGRYQTAAISLSPNVTDGRIYTSSDYGVTWIAASAPAPYDLSPWVSIAISSTGQYQTAVAEGIVSPMHCRC